MKYRKLGKNGPFVSAIGLGCMGMSEFYGPTDAKNAADVIVNAAEKGITFYDTADMYGSFENERLLGKALQPYRKKVVIATKCGIERKGDDLKINNTKKYIKEACEGSLSRLGVDKIDLFYLHRYNPQISIEESMSAMLELVKEGKILHVGLSEVGSDVIEKAYKVLGNSLIALQTEYSLLNRKQAENVLPTCRKLGMAFVPYSPLARGFLSGKIRKPTDFTGEKDDRGFFPQFQGDSFEINFNLVKALEDIAKKKKCTPAQLALAWLLAQGEDIIPIPGTKKIRYLEENIASVDINLSATDLEEIRNAIKDNPIQGPRFPKALMDLFHLETSE